MSQPIVREATIADVPRLVELLQQMSLDGPREALEQPLAATYYAAFEDIQADPRQSLLVIALGGDVVGTATLIIVPNLSYRGRPHAIVDNVVVDEAERGKGLGGRLLRYCLEAAREAGCTRLALTTDSSRTDAHRFYERLGFKHSHKGYRYTFDLNPSAAFGH